jgi:uncharacterized protein (UPF0332 family)
MSFDPERWLQVADVCCIDIPKVDTEALLRTAINRAYYAALLSVKRRLNDVLGPAAVPSSGTHQAIFETLQSGGFGFRDVYRKLRKLRDARDSADYVLGTDPLVRTEVVKYIDISRTLIRNRINAMHDEEYRRLRVVTPPDRSEREK